MVTVYKLLLCWRYLRTRWIALASIVSVTLGVATMIVVNAVMDGFTTEMQDRIHGILSDVVVESRNMEGFYDPDWHLARIREVAGDRIEAATVTVTVPALLNFQYRGTTVTRPVQLIGIDEAAGGMASEFAKYLQHSDNRRQMSFALHESGYDVADPTGGAEALVRPQLADAGWTHRRRWGSLFNHQRYVEEQQQKLDQQQLEPRQTVEPPPMQAPPAQPGETPSTDGSENFGTPEGTPGGSAADGAPADSQSEADAPPGAQVTAAEPAAATAQATAEPAADPFGAPAAAPHRFDPESEQATGCILGMGLSSYRVENGREHFLVVPGDDIKLTFPTVGQPPRAISDVFTIVDFYQSKMSEYDQSFVFVPLRKLQELRGMIEPRTGVGFASSIQIKLKNEADGDLVRDTLQATFPPELYVISTWRDKQGPLLAAVAMETAILNVLLFMIIAVAGFGILAIFFMIVVEKTRDIGILKSLGASGRGVLGIFLGYGLSLGIVGSGVGMIIGLLFVVYINEIAAGLGRVTGREVFDPQIYYFSRIPTIIEPLTVGWIVLGAIAIAVMASVLPARRASRLHPVEALRYE
ncbi:MAG: FtsX-like permease family protein [Pirellulales bacterium]|nr:FtsX-like permease family protein [Pirellulales bacterium]